MSCCSFGIKEEIRWRTGGRSLEKLTTAEYWLTAPALTGQTVSEPAAQGAGVASTSMLIPFNLRYTSWYRTFDSKSTRNKTSLMCITFYLLCHKHPVILSNHSGESSLWQRLVHYTNISYLGHCLLCEVYLIYTLFRKLDSFPSSGVRGWSQLAVSNLPSQVGSFHPHI
jgi:hypothetical protein